MYLLIDEYDSSLNRIFSEAQRELREHLKQPSKTRQEHERFVSETKMEQSMFKRFFAMIKAFWSNWKSVHYWSLPDEFE